jgi:branched-chain amino acid transport system substrate-binding protein
MIQAGMYSAVLHYLKAVEALKSDADGRDGRKMHPAYLFEVKKPEESKYPGDDYKLRASVPADEAFRPMKDDQCPMVNG